MRHLLATTCLTPAILLSAVGARAETVISTARTTAIATSSANNGAADSIKIASAGSIKRQAALQ